MLVSINWLNDFVDLSGEDTETLIKRFTLATAEVEDIIYKGKDISGVVVAKILTCEAHPNSKKLHLLTVDKGDEVVNVVCGAPNARAGITVALATAGGSVCGKPIGKALLAGYESCGMCCSEAELGLSSENAGIIELDESLAAGTSIKDVFPIDDVIFEVDNKSLTNRPDLWGHYGIAREFAALTGKPLRPVPMLNAADYAELPAVSLASNDEVLHRYVAVKADNITVNTSPSYIKIRLFYCGLRPINLLADLTNYVMLELGQPMHAFDGRKANSIEIKRFENPFEFTTLDGQKRVIEKSDLVICANGEPSAVAGVMGGLDSEIADDTSSLLLESACFDAASIRRTSVKLGLRTDASARYEKSLDPENSMVAALRFMKLLLEICPETRITSSFTDLYLKHFNIPVITFDKNYIDRYTGINIPSVTIVKTLTSLGFSVKQDGDNFTVTVPSWRATKDVSIKADLVEEVTRVYGYDNFPFITARSPLYPVKPTVSKTDENTAKDILSRRNGLHEVHSYIWYDAKKNKELKLNLPANLKVINAQTADHDTLRADMTPSLLYFVNENKGYNSEFGIYEIGHTVKGLYEGMAVEEKKLGAVLYSREKSDEKLLVKARDIVAAFVTATRGLSPEFINIKPEKPFSHPKNTSEIFVNGISCGYISILHPTVKNTIDKKAAITTFEINLSEYAKIPGINLSYNETPKYPGIDFDLTIPTPPHIRFADISKAWVDNAPEHLKSVTLIDIYGDTDKNITVRMSFSSPDKTLSMDEVNIHINTITSRLAEMGINIRK
jgi:phenylalanyl-tRNA synthetase beta chain